MGRAALDFAKKSDLRGLEVGGAGFGSDKQPAFVVDSQKTSEDGFSVPDEGEGDAAGGGARPDVVQLSRDGWKLVFGEACMCGGQGPQDERGYVVEAALSEGDEVCQPSGVDAKIRRSPPRTVEDI